MLVLGARSASELWNVGSWRREPSVSNKEHLLFFFFFLKEPDSEKFEALWALGSLP